MKSAKYLLFLGLSALVSCSRPLAPTLAPIDQSTQAPAVLNVSPGAVVELWTGNPGGLIATSSPVPAGTTLIRVRLPSRLLPGQIVRARQKVGFRKSGFSNSISVENNYVTNRYDNERTGWNPHETILTVSKVRRGFGMVCDHAVDAPIRAQPLYVHDVDIPGKGIHNVVFAATDASDASGSNGQVKGDQVWAFDADNCAPLWEDGSGNAGPRELLGAGESIPLVSCGGRHGVWSTPAIDRTTNTMYVVAGVEKGGQSFFRLHAIDIGTGKDRVSPVVIDGTTVQFNHRNITTSFNPSTQNNRPGLLLDRGVVYLAFGSSCDIGSYHGWVVAYDADIPGSASFLGQLGVFNTSPEENAAQCDQAQTSGPPCMAGVWQSGLGLAADGDGTVFCITGNGRFDPDPGRGSYGNTLLRLRLPAAGSGSKQMQIVSFFTPFDWATTYEHGDQDFGSGGPVLFLNGSRRFVLAQGKPARGYLIDRDCANCDGNPNRCIPVTGQACTADEPNLAGVAKSPVIQILGPTNGIAQGMVAGPAYYSGPSGARIYYGFNYSPMAAFDFQPSPPHLVTPPELTLDSAPVTSPIATISSRGKTPGSGILWSVFHPASVSQPLTLHAYDANDLQDNLFHRHGSTQISLDVGDWVPLGNHAGNSFQVPTVIHGKVYCGSKNRLVVFAPHRRQQCSFVADCGGAVTFYCGKDPDADELQLQRKQNGAWKIVSDAASTRNLGVFVHFWDYPAGEGARYRVCSKSHPEDCTPEFVPKVNRLPCGIGLDNCGRPGKPPCFLGRPWPVSLGEEKIKKYH